MTLRPLPPRPIPDADPADLDATSIATVPGGGRGARGRRAPAVGLGR